LIRRRFTNVDHRLERPKERWSVSKIQLRSGSGYRLKVKQGGEHMSRITLVFSGALLASAFSTQVFAAEVIKTDHLNCFAGPIHLIQHADGIVSGSYDVVATSPGTEGTPFRMLSGHCVGAFSNVSGQYDENGSCEWVDAGGDKFLGVFARKGDPAKAEGTWQIVHGTGKFADMSGQGKWMPIGTFPASGMPNMINGCNHDWGSFSMK
jgi:hypothetical protein